MTYVVPSYNLTLVAYGVCRVMEFSLARIGTLPITLLHCSALQSADTKLSGLWDMGAMKRLVKRRLIQSTLEEISLELDDAFVRVVVSMQHFHIF